MSSIEGLQDEVITGISNAASEILGQVTKCEPQTVFMGLKKDAPPMNLEIAGLIGITGAFFQGNMWIGFPKPTFLFLVNRMFGENATEIKPEYEDAAAEITNMIYGKAKVPLNEDGHDIRMALPSVLKGGKLTSGATNAESEVVVLSLEDHPVWLEFQGEAIPESKSVTPSAASASAEKKPLDASVFMSFVDGIRKTLGTQCNVEVAAKRPVPKTAAAHIEFDLGAIIGLTGNGLRGTFGLFFKRETYKFIAESMFREKIDVLSPELEDGVGELVNIIFGDAKVTLNQKGYAVKMALPRMIRGEKMDTLAKSKNHMVLPFDTKGGTFWVEFNFSVE